MGTFSIFLPMNFFCIFFNFCMYLFGHCYKRPFDEVAWAHVPFFMPSFNMEFESVTFHEHWLNTVKKHPL